LISRNQRTQIVVVAGTRRHPLRIERHADGTVDVTLDDEAHLTQS
jgi:hypothetical protein